MGQVHVFSHARNLIKTLAFTCVIAAFANSNTLAQDLDMDCRKIMLPEQCRSLQSQIVGREALFQNEIDTLTEDLQNAPQHQKPRLRLQIQRLRQKLANDLLLRRLRADLARCRQEFDRVPRRTLAPNVLVSGFRGQVIAKTKHPRVEVTEPSNILMTLQFSRDRCVVTITSFLPFTFRQPTPIGDVDVTVSKVGGGTGNFFPLSGQVLMPIELDIHYDTHLVDDDRATTTFTTGNTVSRRGSFNVNGVKFTSTNNAPVDQCARTVGGIPINCTITLVGTTVFQGGFLGGHEGALTVTGNIGVPLPPPGQQTRAECLETCQERFEECLVADGPGSTTHARCSTRRTQCRNRCPRQPT